MEELADVLLSAARSGTRDGIVSFDGVYWSTVSLRAVAEGRRERGDAAGATALEELARLEPGDVESRSKAAARALITRGGEPFTALCSRSSVTTASRNPGQARTGSQPLA